LRRRWLPNSGKAQPVKDISHRGSCASRLGVKRPCAPVVRRLRCDAA
jgi:hypothetical protein